MSGDSGARDAGPRSTTPPSPPSAPRELASRFSWGLVSLALHALAVVAIVWLQVGRPPPEPEPVPVTLLEEKPLPEPPPPERRRLRFRTPPRVRVLEQLDFPQESPALAPPPPDAPRARVAAGGGTSVEVAVPSVFTGFTLAGEGGGTAGLGVGSGNALDLGGSSFAEYLGQLRELGLDVVFVIDATGTMGPVIDEVKGRLRDLAGAIRRLVPVTRFGIVAYRDHDDPEFVTKVEPLTLSVRKLGRFLDGLRARGGGDFPEAVDEGLRAAVERSGWSADARWVVVLVGDAPPHPERLGSALAVAGEFRRGGGTVTALDVSFDANPRLAAARLGVRVDELTTIARSGVMPEFRAIAEAGGGDAATLDGHVRVVGRLAMLVFGDEYAEEVRPLLGDL